MQQFNLNSLLCLLVIMMFYSAAHAQIVLPKNTGLFTIANDSAFGRVSYTFDLDADTASQKRATAKYKGVTNEFRQVKVLGSLFWVAVSDFEKAVEQQVQLQTKVPAKAGYEQTGTSSTSTSTSTYESSATQCTGTTKSGRRCKRTTTSKNGRCWQH